MDEPLKIGTRARSPLEESLICPLTQRLPLDPVTAEDGIVYERRAIELYFNMAALVPSPLNRELWIGTRLLPAPRHYQIIEASIANGDVSRPFAREWKLRVFEKERMNQLLERAGSGNPEAMLAVAKNYFAGREGFEQDPVIAYNWYRTAHKLHGKRPMRLVEIASLSPSLAPPTMEELRAAKMKEEAMKKLEAGEAEVDEFLPVPTYSSTKAQAEVDEFFPAPTYSSESLPHVGISDITWTWENE